MWVESVRLSTNVGLSTALLEADAKRGTVLLTTPVLSLTVSLDLSAGMDSVSQPTLVLLQIVPLEPNVEKEDVSK